MDRELEADTAWAEKGVRPLKEKPQDRNHSTLMATSQAPNYARLASRVGRGGGWQ